MSKYKNLILIGISLSVGFGLALVFGSAEESELSDELCQLCQNKTLVKEAIMAVYENFYDANLPEQFDPNYVQAGRHESGELIPYPDIYGAGLIYGDNAKRPSIENIIAEGDMVAVLIFWVCGVDSSYYGNFTQMAIFRIANGRIVAGCVDPAVSNYFYPPLP